MNIVKKQSGFTLIEVLVAMAVFAITAMAVLNATSQNARTLMLLEEKTFASMVADNQLVLLTLQESVPSSEKSGKEKMAGKEWHWTIKPVKTSDNLLRAVDVIVWSDERKKDPLTTVRTYVPTSTN